MGRLRLSLAIGDYDHVRDLTDGAVAAEGIELIHLDLPIEEIFYRFTRFREWDVSELSMGKYSAMVAAGDRSLCAIPVFPSRVFRHSSIYIRSGGPVASVADLRGKRIGVPEWAQTAAIYTRGLLTHEYGIGLDQVEWFQAGVDQPGRQEKVELSLPKGVNLTRVPDGTLDQMLLTGELDAIATARPPRAFRDQRPEVVRLFRDPQAVEEAYFRKTGILPIMHVVVCRREVVEANPWVCMNLFTAFDEARRRSIQRLGDLTVSRAPLPWVAEHARKMATLFGELFPYGIEPNRTTLDAFLNFCFEQGVCSKLLQPEDLFVPEVASTYRV